MTPNEPGLFGVSRLLARASARRWFNRMGQLMGKRGGDRTGTARKSGRSPVVMVVFGGLMLFQSFMVSSFFVDACARQTRIYHIDSLEGADREAASWVPPELEDELLGLLAPVLTMLALALVFYTLGSGNTELSQVGWSMEWLFTFPVPTRGLFLAKVGEYALSSAFTWFTVFPLLATIFWVSGYGVVGLLLSLFATLCLALMIAAVRVFVETALRKRMSLHRLKNYQALFTILGMVFFLGAFMVALGRTLPASLAGVARTIGEPLLWTPLAYPLQVVRGGLGMVGLAAWTGAIVYAGLIGARRLVRDGLVSAGGPYQGTRKPAGAPRPEHGRVQGVLGKDLKLLGRDRNFMVQTLVVPLLLIGFQAFVNPAMFRAGGDPRLVSVVAFGVGAYVLMFGGFSILAVEGNALWLLFSLPERLDRVMRQKAMVWAVPGLVYALAVLSFGWRPEALSAPVLVGPLLALLGIVLFAFLAAGMGVMGTDPFEREMQRKVRPEWSMLYMLVAGIYGYSIVKADLWGQTALLVLVTMLTWSIWDRVRERLPYALDPTQLPPPGIAMNDGLVAALVFFALQGIIQLALAAARNPALIPVGYALAGALTVALTCYSLKRLKVPRLARAVGLRGEATGRAVALGVALGVATGVFAMGYLLLVRRLGVEVPKPPLESWMILLMVGLAPFFEEFIFRGLVFNGMRKSTRLPFAVLGSAAIFGVVHPPISFAPVFLLGVTTAYAFHRTGVLWSSIAAHATYNAIVLFVQV